MFCLWITNPRYKKRTNDENYYDENVDYEDDDEEEEDERGPNERLLVCLW